MRENPAWERRLPCQLAGYKRGFSLREVLWRGDVVSCHQVLVRPRTWQLLGFHLCLGHVVVTRIEVLLLEEGKEMGLLICSQRVGTELAETETPSPKYDVLRSCWDGSRAGHKNIMQGENQSRRARPQVKGLLYTQTCPSASQQLPNSRHQGAPTPFDPPLWVFTACELSLLRVALAV